MLHLRKAICIVAILLSIVGCGAAEESSGSEVRLGYLPIASDASFFVALENGYFRDEGIDVELVEFQSSNQTLEALLSGRIDATAIVALQAALSLEANSPGEFKIIEMTAADSGTTVHQIVAADDSDIRSLRDLSGTTIGTFPGSQMTVFLRLVLDGFVSPDSVRILELRPSIQPQAISTGRVSALFCLEPVCTVVQKNSFASPIEVNPLYKFIQQPFPTAVSLVSSDLYEERPEVVGGLQRALARSHEFIRLHTDSARSILPKYVAVERSVADSIGLYDYWTVDEINREAVSRLTDIYVQHNILPQSVDTNDLYSER